MSFTCCAIVLGLALCVLHGRSMLYNIQNALSQWDASPRAGIDCMQCNAMQVPKARLMLHTLSDPATRQAIISNLCPHSCQAVGCSYASGRGSGPGAGRGRGRAPPRAPPVTVPNEDFDFQEMMKKFNKQAITQVQSASMCGNCALTQ